MSKPSVVASGISYRVNGATLLDDVDFQASPGEVVGLIGPNGAGKSTLLRLLSGELLPGVGTVTVNGLGTSDTSAMELSRARSVLGHLIPTDIPFTVRSIVEMGRHPYRRDPTMTPNDDRIAVDGAMHRTGIMSFADRVFASLSKGEQLRVALARVLAQDASIVLLDEPTASLDVGNSESVLAEVTALARSGHTLISVFHDLNQAAFHCDRICLLSVGRVVVAGSVREVVRSDVLTAVYDQPMEVVQHPFRDCPLVLVVDRPRSY